MSTSVPFYATEINFWIPKNIGTQSESGSARKYFLRSPYKNVHAFKHVLGEVPGCLATRELSTAMFL